jgi:hypothetical protein
VAFWLRTCGDGDTQVKAIFQSKWRTFPRHQYDPSQIA